jgi:hypothetical protein
MIEGFEELAENLKQHTLEAFNIYNAAINRICNNKVQDEKEIEHILDNLLTYCGDDDMLLLYKKLCRYYYDINPIATFEHINIYRDMWDEEASSEEV